MTLGSISEVTLLVVAVIIGLVDLVWATAAAGGGARDMAWLMGPRDEPRPVSGVPARLQRAYANFLETFPLYAAAVLADVAAGKTGHLSLWGSWLYVLARLVYMAIYATGWPVVRTLVWAVSMVGIVMIVVAYFQ